MRTEEAFEASVTYEEAAAECRHHHVEVSVRESDAALIEADSQELISEIDNEGYYSGEKILTFLGY